MGDMDRSASGSVPSTAPGSGVTPGSGAPSATWFSGPWFVENQSLQGGYVRRPKGYWDGGGEHLTLSSVSGSWNFNGTSLYVHVDAMYQSYKDYNVYETSSWVEPQTFKVLALSADAQGNTYGDLTATAAGTTAHECGPAGTIVTDQMFYRRVPWDDVSAGHVEVNRSMTGSNFYGVEWNYGWASGVGTTITSGFTPTDGMENNFTKSWIKVRDQGTFLYATEDALGDRGNYPGGYWINGTYAVNKETQYQVRAFIDQMGLGVTNAQWFANPPNADTYGGALRDQGFGEYSINRHSY